MLLLLYSVTLYQMNDQYQVYTVAFYALETVRQEYRHKWGTDNSVQINDVVFAIHALMLDFGPNNHLSISRIIIAMVPNIYIHHIHCFNIYICSDMEPRSGMDWILLLFISREIGYYVCKVHNQDLLSPNKSTVGWSIGNIMLDLSGRVLSMIQLMYDSWLAKDWTG